MNISSVNMQRTPSELLEDAAEWRLLAVLFACPRGDWHNQVATLAGEVRDERLQLAARAAVEEGLDCVYHTAFGPGGPAAPREVSHRQSALTGQYLADLLACYDAFAYCPPRDEPPDHIATEIDFIAYMRLKQAFAAARNDEIQAGVTNEAAQRFIEDHLATTAVPLTQTLESSGIRYLAVAAAALADRVGPRRSKSVSSSPELDQLCNPALPICDTGDCCTEFAD